MARRIKAIGNRPLEQMERDFLREAESGDWERMTEQM
jgi:hypothetical protein